MRRELRAAIRELAEERERLPGGAAPDLIAEKWELTPGETAALMSRKERTVSDILRASEIAGGVIVDIRETRAAKDAADAAYEHIAAWCEERAEEAVKLAERNAGYPEGRRQEGRCEAFAKVARALREAAR